MKVWIGVSEDNHIVHDIKDESGITAEPYCFSNWITNIRKDYDVIHLQYLQGNFQSVISTLKFILSIIIVKIVGINIVWTGHHTQSHEVSSTILDWIGRQILLFFTDHVIVLEDPIKKQLKETYYISSKISVVPLGNYRTLHSERQKEGDQAINFPEQQPFAAVIGLLRKYKQVPLAIRSVDHSSNANGMLIAGKPHSTTIKQDILAAINQASINISFHSNFISDIGLVRYIEKSDVVLVLNNQETLPATALLAAGCETPIVTTPGGVKEYLVERYGIGIVAESTHEEDIAYAIDEILGKEIEPKWRLFNKDHNWQNYVERHLSIYSNLN